MSDDLNANFYEKESKISSDLNKQNPKKIVYVPYEGEIMLPDIVSLMEETLSEPYNVYTYRFFLEKNPDLCLLAYVDGKCVGAVVSKIMETPKRVQGNLGMVSVRRNFRRLGIGRYLVQWTLDMLQKKGCDEVVLETEVKNYEALTLYESLGFVRTKFLPNYYTTRENAYRLKFFFNPIPDT